MDRHNSDTKSHNGKVIPMPRRETEPALDQRSDDELMQLASANLRQAMAELVRRYERRVRAFCLKWNAARGDDLAQDAFLSLWQARHRYRPSGKFEVFLFTIVRNRCRNARRQWIRRIRRGLPEAPAVDPRQGEQLQALLEKERRRQVNQEIADLPAKLREAVLLRFGEGLDYADISAIVRAPEATVRSRVFLGLKRLRENLKEGRS